MLIFATFCHTRGSEPEPICVWILTIFSPYFFAISLICGMYSNHIPKEDAGPPTFVRCVPPEPSPGFILTPTSPPRAIFPNSSSWRREQALYKTPALTIPFKSAGSCCDESEMRAGAMPARIARSTSYSPEASICKPRESNSFRMAAFDEAFIAYLTVSPKALGNARAAFACFTSEDSSYT